MKKIALFLALALSSMAVFAQNLNRSELKQLQNFLAQPAEKHATNAEALKITDVKTPAGWEGVTITDGRVTAIDWKGKGLAGTLDLSGFKSLAKVDVSRNRLTGIKLAGDAALSELNASRNRLSEIDLDGCGQLVKVSLNNNRITEFTLQDVPFVKNINIASNLLAALDLQASSTLETLNCQSNHLESLTVACK